MKLSKIPTGIKTFDVNINGGFPVGSVILLLEDVGAGAREFVYTSIFNTNKAKEECGNADPVKIKNNGNNGGDNDIATFSVFPDKICYVSLSRSKEDILNENAYSFHKGFHDAIKDGLVFKDLSSVYFRDSIVQNLWLSGNKEIGSCRDSGKTILEEISLFLKGNSENNVVIIDSLTDLMMSNVDHLNRDDVVMFLKGMVRVAKTWNGIIYVILSTDILEKHVQKLIAEIVDGVLIFEWYNGGSVKMQRNMYVSKFRGLMPKLEQNKIAKFEIKITSDNGLEVSNVRKII